MNTSKLNLIPLSLASLTILASTILVSSIVSADDSIVDEINITVPVSCTISGTGMNTHNANINNGVYVPDIGSTTLHAFCNDNEGFAIYVAGYTGNEVGGTNSNKLVGTTASGNATIESGIATTAGNPDVSNWAMKLTMTQDSGDTTTDNAFTIDSAPNEALPSQADPSATSAPFSNYHVVPNEYVKVAHKNSGTDMTATTGGVKLTTTYAAYISKTQAADTYSGQVIYTLVHPASQSAPLVCNPNGTTISTVACMQDISTTNKSTILASMTEDQQYTLADKRDGKSYTVAKLKDGNIWMTQNLDLDLDSNKTYTNLDTDLGWNGVNYSDAVWSPTRSTYDSSTAIWCENGIWNETHSSCSGDYSVPESYDPGDLYWNGETNSGAQQSHIVSNGIPQYHLGNYYNWNAAVALNDSSEYPATVNATEDINQSICPVNWTLPKADSSNTSGSFGYLLERYGWTTSSQRRSDNREWYEHPLYIALSGEYYGDNTILMDGSYSELWSSMAHDSGNTKYSMAMQYIFSGDYIWPYGGGAPRRAGYSVRCVVR